MLSGYDIIIVANRDGPRRDLVAFALEFGSVQIDS